MFGDWKVTSKGKEGIFPPQYEAREAYRKVHQQFDRRVAKRKPTDIPWRTSGRRHGIVIRSEFQTEDS